MTSCPQCHRESPTGAQFCSACGSSLQGTSPLPTLAEGIDSDATNAWQPSASDREALGNGGPRPDGQAGDRDIATGTLLIDRYRVLNRLGRGGMGTVYRAEDLKLRQDVALKFLRDELAGDERAISQLVNEVRTARRISHPHVCRVHDIGEISGQTFISMEYVDGEDLSSLLRRIGRLSGDKAVQIARQLCSGLHAAHERGVLHRDLKPGNVMLDGEGNVRITDFGIAAAVECVSEEKGSSGTPAYMAPELFTGGTASVQSDVYALGLVLYELYTGGPLFRAKSMTELLRHHRQPIATLATFPPDIDPQVERVIMSCLARQPEQRPHGAMGALARLPGGDLLAEALASGKTPSPELIAASGGAGKLRPRTAGIVVAALVLGMITLFGLESHVKLFARTPLPRSPEVLADRARQALAKLGYESEDVDRVYGFEVNEDYLQEICDTRPTSDEWNERLDCPRPMLIDFWYRTVPHPAHLRPTGIKGRVTWTDPVPAQPGDVQARLDPFGRMRELLVIPASKGVAPRVAQTESAPDPTQPDWSALFEVADLPLERFRPVPPALVPHAFADTRAAWIGSYAETPDLAVRVEAAALQGRPVALRLFEQRWESTTPLADDATSMRTWRFLARIALVLAAVVLSYRTITQRRGDARGAFRLGLLMFSLVAAFTMLAGDHGGDWSLIGSLVVKGMMHGLVVATEFALFYFALEPYVRRIWPETLISWSRLLTGRGRDPLVGHHVLIGESLGIVSVLIIYLTMLIPRWSGNPEGAPLMLHSSGIEALSGTAEAAGALLEIAVDFARNGMMFFMSLVVAKLILRRRELAGVANVLVWASVWTPETLLNTGFPWISWVWLSNAVLAAAITVFAIRVGLLALIVGFVFFGTITSLPLQLGSDTWFSGPAVLVLVLVAAATVFGVRTATRSAG